MRLASQRGQTAVEYLGVLVVVSVLIAAVAGSSVGDAVRGGMERAVCKILQGPDCAAAVRPPHRGGRPSVRPPRVPLAHAAGANGPGDGPPPAAVESARRELRAAQRAADRAFRRMLRHLDSRTIARFDRALDRLRDAAGHADGMGLDRQAARARARVTAGRVALFVARAVDAAASGRLREFVAQTINDVLQPLKRYLDRLAQARARADYIRALEDYGRKVAQKRLQEDPDLSDAQLGDIAVNAASALNNKTVLDDLLKQAVKEGKGAVHTVRVPAGKSPEAMAREWQEALTVGSRSKAAQGSYPQQGGGLRELPDLDGGWSGGTVGLRTEAGRTSTGGGPVLDINVPGRGYIKIQFQP